MRQVYPNLENVKVLKANGRAFYCEEEIKINDPYVTPEPDYIHVEDEVTMQQNGSFEDAYRGRFVTGMGFYGIIFPKSDVRELTEDEKKALNASRFYM